MSLRRNEPALLPYVLRTVAEALGRMQSAWLQGQLQTLEDSLGSHRLPDHEAMTLLDLKLLQ